MALVSACVFATGSVAAAPPVPDAPGTGLDERTGTVRGYVINEFGDVDGIRATNDDVVRFPPHMGRDLVATLKPGDDFVATGSDLSGGTFRAYSLGRPGTRPLVESRPSVDGAGPVPRDVRRAALTEMTVDGPIAAVVRGNNGDIEGVLVDDGTTVKLPPRNPLTNSPRLRVGAMLHATGYGTVNRYGRALRAVRLGLDGQPPVTLQPAGPSLPPRPPPDAVP